MPKYCVPVIFRGLDNFIVEADTPEAAKEVAEEAFKGGVDPDECGNEWQEFESAGAPDLVTDADHDIDTRPGRDDSHGPQCAQRFVGAAECDCGKADRAIEEADDTDQIGKGGIPYEASVPHDTPPGWVDSPVSPAWTSEWPQTEGRYWFYGQSNMKDSKPRLQLVEVKMAGSGSGRHLIYIGDGAFFYPSDYTGQFTPAIVPTLPGSAKATP